MTHVVVFVPTNRYGGLDVTVASIKRQTCPPDAILIQDELLDKRQVLWKEAFDPTPVTFFTPTIHDGNKRNLAAGYNMALRWAYEHYNDDALLISLQDYIYVPEDGIEKFIKLHFKRPNDLITGVTHISKDPYPELINSPDGLYTIFNSPYEEKPQEVGWWDVRVTEIYKDFPKGSVLSIGPEHFETNWAAIPSYLADWGVEWDESFDEGIAYENVDFAQTAMDFTSCEIMFDMNNYAISLPHKDYFEGEREEIQAYTNRWKYETKWK